MFRKRTFNDINDIYCLEFSLNSTIILQLGQVNNSLDSTRLNLTQIAVLLFLLFLPFLPCPLANDVVAGNIPETTHVWHVSSLRNMFLTSRFSQVV